MWDQPPQYSGLDTVNPAKDLSTISHLCHIYNDNLNKLAKTMVRAVIPIVCGDSDTEMLFCPISVFSEIRNVTLKKVTSFCTGLSLKGLNFHSINVWKLVLAIK